MSGSIDMRGGMGMMDGYGSGSYDQSGGNMYGQQAGYGNPYGQHGQHGQGGFMPHAQDYATASHGASAAMHGRSESWGSSTWNAGMRSSGGGHNTRASGSPARRGGRGGRPAKPVAVRTQATLPQLNSQAAAFLL